MISRRDQRQTCPLAVHDCLISVHQEWLKTVYSDHDNDRRRRLWRPSTQPGKKQ